MYDVMMSDFFGHDFFNVQHFIWIVSQY